MLFLVGLLAGCVSKESDFAGDMAGAVCSCLDKGPQQDACVKDVKADVLTSLAAEGCELDSDAADLCLEAIAATSSRLEGQECEGYALSWGYGATFSACPNLCEDEPEPVCGDTARW